MNKFNFGHGVTLFFLIFMSASLYQLFLSTQFKSELVKEDYYIDDIGLENQLQKQKNAKELNGFSCTYDNQQDSLHIRIPSSRQISGFIEITSPNDMEDDRKIRLEMLNQKSSISLKDFRKGKWNLILSWTDGEKEFLYNANLIHT